MSTFNKITETLSFYNRSFDNFAKLGSVHKIIIAVSSTYYHKVLPISSDISAKTRLILHFVVGIMF